MKMHGLVRKAGSETIPAWPPNWTGAVFQRVGNLPGPTDGVLTSVDRPERNSLIGLRMAFDGNDYTGLLAWDEPPVPSAVERLLKANVGRLIRDIGNLEVRS